MAEKRVLVRGMAEKYRRGVKKEKSRLVDELVEVTGYNRSYAAWLLNQQGETGDEKGETAETGDTRNWGRDTRNWGRTSTDVSFTQIHSS